MEQQASALIIAILNSATVIGAAASALEWLRASQIEVPDNIDTIVQALRRQAKLNAHAAACAAAAAACQGILILLQRYVLTH
jgi:hypothetical protein